MRGIIVRSGLLGIEAVAYYAVLWLVLVCWVLRVIYFIVLYVFASGIVADLLGTTLDILLVLGGLTASGSGWIVVKCDVRLCVGIVADAYALLWTSAT